MELYHATAQLASAGLLGYSKQVVFGGVLALGADRQIRTSGTPELAFRLERRPDAPHLSFASITLLCGQP